MTRKSLLCTAAFVCAFAPLAAPSAQADDDADFFKGKTLTYVVAAKPGGGYDAYARLIARYMAKRLPAARIAVANKPGRDHITGANFVYAAKPDGLTIGTFRTGLIYAQIVRRKRVRFDLAAMSWIGKASEDPRVFMVSEKSGIATFGDLKKAKEPIRVATAGVGSAAHNETIMLAEALDLRFRIMPGYGGSRAEMAMMRGEITARLGSKSAFEAFVKNGFGRFIFQVGGSGAVPQAAKLATTDDGRALAALVAAQATLGQLTAGPPGLPVERLKRLVDAYRDSLTDPDLRKEAAALGLPIVPLYGTDVGKMVTAALDQSPNTIRRIAEVMNTR